MMNVCKYWTLFCFLLWGCKSTINDPCQLSMEDTELNDHIMKLVNTDKLDEAEKLLINRLEKGNPKQVFLYNMGAVLFIKYELEDDQNFDERDRIIGYIKDGDRLCPDRKTTIGGLMEISYVFHDYQKTIEYAEKYIALFGGDTAAYTRLSGSYNASALNEPHKALRYSENALELDSLCSHCHYLKGTALVEMKEYQGALDSYNTALKLEPNVARVLYSIGAVHHRRNEKEKALSYYLEALELQKGKKLMNLMAIGNIAADFGNKELACEYYTLALESPCKWCTPMEMDYWNRKKHLLKGYCEN